MLKNYLKVALRSFRKNLSYTLINILGLAIGLSGTILTFLLFQYEANFDSLQKNTGQIFRVNSIRNIENEEQKWGITPLPIGIEAADQISGVEGFCRYAETRLLLKHEDNIHRESIFFADSVFFDWFQFKTLSGNTSTFKNKNTVIIDQNIARKYFADEDPIGKSFNIFLNNNLAMAVQVGAVLETVPKNSSLQYKIILPFENIYEIYGINKTEWNIDIRTITYLNLHPDASSSVIEAGLNKFVPKHNELLEDWKVTEFYMIPFKAQRDESRILYSAITWPGLPISALYGSLFMNTIILLISCFNFMNTAIAYSRKRLKEIGIRKTFGGLKNQIVIQFMMENFIQAFVALIVAIEITHFWVNWMNSQWPIQLEPEYSSNPWLLGFLFGLVIFVTLISGAYPAFYVTRFKPYAIFKGDLQMTGTKPLSKILLTYQFTFSITAIFSGIALILNAQYQNTLDWGYDKDNVIVVPVHDVSNFVAYRDVLSENSNISLLSGSVHNIGYNHEVVNFDLEGMQHQSQLVKVGDNYLETLGLKLHEGRDFMKYSENDKNESIIVNRKFLETFEIEDPMNSSIILDNNKFYIVGVIEDIMPYGLSSPKKPIIIQKINESACTLLSVNVPNTSINQVYSQMEASWKKLYPNLPFNGYYQSDSYQAATYINQGVLKQFGLMALFGLILSVSGLYTMVSLNIDKRIKEIGIRKVLGASISQIVNLINREFIIILVISSVLGTTLGYFFINMFLGSIYDYYIPVGPGIFLISVIVVVATAMLTSGKKILDAAHMNPTNSLQYE